MAGTPITTKKHGVAERLPEVGVGEELLVVLEADELDVAPVREARDVHVGEADDGGDHDRQHAEGDEQQHRRGDEDVRGELFRVRMRLLSGRSGSVVGRTSRDGRRRIEARRPLPVSRSRCPRSWRRGSSSAASRSAPLSAIALSAVSSSAPTAPSQLGTIGSTFGLGQLLGVDLHERVAEELVVLERARRRSAAHR